MPGMALRHTLRRLLVALFLLLAGALRAWAGTPPTVPMLRIVADGHTGVIPALAVDAAGDLLATASYDKTVRLWSLPDGVEREVLHPPIGRGREGELYAVALTPDGRRVFAAGATGGSWDGSFSIYVFSVRTGRLIARLPDLPSPVFALAVSPDGTRFAAGLAKGGVRVWNAATGKPLFADPHYNGPVRALAFDRTNRLFVTAADGKVRAYDAAGRLIAAVAPEPGLEPWGLAVSPDGDLIAVSFTNTDQADRVRVDVLAAATLRRVFVPDTGGLTGNGLLAVAWADDSHGGVQLLAGGYARKSRRNVIRRWADYGLGGFIDLPAARDTILALAALPGGGAVYSAADPGWGLIAANGRVLRHPQPPMADLRPARNGKLLLSAHGNVVAFALRSRRAAARGIREVAAAPPATTPGAAGRLLYFDAHTLQLSAAPPSPMPPLAGARLDAPGLTVRDWRDTDAPQLNGRLLRLDPEEYSRSLAILPDGRGVLLGTDTHLRPFSPDGHQLAVVPIPAPAWAVSVSADSRVAVAALLDGTIRWYGLGHSGRITPRTALFVAANPRRWVLFTPQGFFTAAPQGGSRMVGFEVDRGSDQQPAWVSFSAAYRLFFAPRVVQAQLAGNPVPALSRMATLGNLRDQLARKPMVEVTGVCLPQPDGGCHPLALPPVPRLRIPATAARIGLAVKLVNRGIGIGPIDLFVNGRNVGRLSPPTVGSGPATDKVDVPLDPGTDHVRLRVYDSAANVFSETRLITLLRAGGSPVASPGRLFIFAIGINHFAAPSLTLRYAVPDAKTFVRLMRRDAAPLYHSINVTLLTDAAASRAAIMTAFARLSHEIQPADTFLFYVASHGGVNPIDGRFLLVPSNMEESYLTSWQRIERHAITETALVRALAAIRARDALLFIDTCYSGRVTADALANVSHEVGRYMISASSSVQEALDSYNHRNGVMMYALRQGLDGLAPHGPDGVIGALSLGEYLSARITQLALRRGHVQNAEFKAAQRDLRSFPVAEILHPTKVRGQ